MKMGMDRWWGRQRKKVVIAVVVESKAAAAAFGVAPRHRRAQIEG